MLIFFAILLAFYLDLLWGDPPWLLHPVVLMGHCITRAETLLRRILPKTERGSLIAGLVLCSLLPLLVLFLTGLACYWATRLHPLAGFALQAFWCWQALALRGLRTEAEQVHAALALEDLPKARKQLSRIVGRDTEELSEQAVIRATVETLSENFTDGVLAPLLYMTLGGAPLALCYKSINTMDSMIGYKTARYLYFGRAAARLDDVVNYLPARLGALLWIFAAALLREDAQAAWQIWRRDRRRHASPNAAQTEAACAGALGISLAGEAHYFGERYDKPEIGDALRPPEANDILRTIRLLYTASLSALLLLMAALAIYLNYRGGFL